MLRLSYHCLTDAIELFSKDDRHLLDLSEAALRALGALDAADQRQLADTVTADATLGPRIRRIARRVKQKGYPITKATAEVRGEAYVAAAAPNGNGTVPVALGTATAVLPLLDLAE